MKQHGTVLVHPNFNETLKFVDQAQDDFVVIDGVTGHTELEKVVFSFLIIPIAKPSQLQTCL